MAGNFIKSNNQIIFESFNYALFSCLADIVLDTKCPLESKYNWKIKSLALFIIFIIVQTLSLR